MKIRILVTILLVFNIIACSSEPGCFVADIITPVNTVKINGSEYFIYRRISGFQEKITFYELYKGKPIFDACGQSNFASVYGESVEPLAGVVSKLIVKDKKLIIIYSKEPSQLIGPKNITIEVKE